MKNEFLNLTREELEKEHITLREVCERLQNEVNQEDEIIANLLNCWVCDITVINKWLIILENKLNFNFWNILEYIENNLWKDYKINFNTVILAIFDIILNEFQKENSLELEEWKDFNVDLNYYCSDIYFVDEKMQDKFDKWL